MQLAIHHTVKRRKAVSLLQQATSSFFLVVVSAPTGYGKTTVAHEFARSAKADTCYFSIPKDSYDADVIWNMLWKDMEMQGMAAAPELRRMGFPQNPAQIRQAIDIFNAHPPTIVILDDYHNCGDQTLDSVIEAIISAETNNTRLLVFSRIRPGITLEELQVKELAVVYDQRLLAFSSTEAREYFLAGGIFDESLADNAWKYSEGWAAALWLCFRNAQNNDGMPPSGDIESLLDRAVFSTYSKAEQSLLMQLSVLDWFSVGEAENLTLDTAVRQKLVRLRNRNALIGRHPNGRGYQFHSIFKDFLQKRLAGEPTLNRPELYRSAAECHASRKEYMAAYRQLVKAGRDQDQVRFLDLLLEQSAGLEADGLWEEIHAAVLNIPWRLRLQQPYGYLAYIWLYVSTVGDHFNDTVIKEAEVRFRRAKNLSALQKRRLAGELEFIRGALAFNDRVLMVKHYKKARELLAGPSFLPYSRLSWTFSCPHVSFLAQRKSGEYAVNAKHAERDWDNTFATLAGESGAGGSIIFLAEYHLERGELAEAEQLLIDLEEFSEEGKNPTLFLTTLFSRARLHLAKGKPQEALTLMRQSVPTVKKIDMFEHTLCHDLASTYIQACLGQGNTAPRWLADGNIYGPPYGIAQCQSFMCIVYGKMLLVRGEYESLATLIANAPDNLGPFEYLFGRIHKKIFEAILARRRHDMDSAMEAMRAALDLSRPDGIILPIIEYGESVTPLLKHLRKTLPDDPHLNRIYEWCVRVSQVSEGNKSYKKSILTPREKEVMRLVIKGRTTPSIAKKLCVAEVTVKKALSHAYVKLGAANRVEAANRFAVLHNRKPASGRQSY